VKVDCAEMISSTVNPSVPNVSSTDIKFRDLTVLTTFVFANNRLIVKKNGNPIQPLSCRDPVVNSLDYPRLGFFGHSSDKRDDLMSARCVSVSTYYYIPAISDSFKISNACPMHRRNDRKTPAMRSVVMGEAGKDNAVDTPPVPASMRCV
jgi:hypothetical protein